MNPDLQPLVSVVTPVYNGEKYLVECIESVLAQTYQNWEYVIVNNCSTDRSLDIAEHFAQRETRIRICNNTQFLNQMQNWNHAMQQISPESKYCKVVHADDWLFPDCLAKMVEVAETNPSVGIVSAYRLDENRVNLDGLPYPSTVIPGREICRSFLLGGPYFFGSPTSLLIRSDFIFGKNKFYNENYIHADHEVCFDVLQHSDFGFVHQVLTFTRRHNEATTSLIHRFETYRLRALITLKKYGPIYLSQEEYRARLARKLDHYYTYLGSKVFELKEKAFWDYHKSELEKLGYSLSRIKLLKAAFTELLDLRTTTKKFREALKAKYGKKQQPSNELKDKKWSSIVSRSET